MARNLQAVLVGCGGISSIWLDALKNIDVDLVGLVDLNKTAAAQRAKEYDLQQVEIGKDLTAMLKKTSPDIVFDLTVPSAHVDVTRTALAYGCHVLGEKPLADSMDNARRSIEAAEKTGKLYSVMQNRRYDPNIRRLRRFLCSKAIGTLTTINSDFYIGAHMGGWWYHTKHVLLLDMAIHTFDAARLLSGADPVSVYCKEWNPAGSWFAHGASATAIFEMTNDIVYSYRGSWCGEGLRTPWESEWRILGDLGSARWDGAETIQAEIATEVPGYFATLEEVDIPPYDPGDRIGRHGGVIQDFVDSVRNGTVPETICTDNIKSLAMVFGAIESAEKGKPVDIHW